MTVKPGDRIWAGATFGETTDGRPTATVDGHGFLVDHPALPAVARWLVDHGDEAADVVTIGLNAIEAINEYEYDGECGFHLTDMNKIRDREAITALRGLIAALTGGEVAGGG